jgi:hypothetical protein
MSTLRRSDEAIALARVRVADNEAINAVTRDYDVAL